MKPDFIIAWVAKCWSSSLYDILSAHSQIYFPWIKEINYFNTDFHDAVKIKDIKFYEFLKKNTSKFFDKAMCVWAWIVEDENEYASLYKNHSGELLWDGSIWYFHSTVAAANIYKNNPKVKIIFLFRDPVQRRISHYWMLKWLWMTSKSISQLLLDYSTWDLNYQETVLFNSSFYQKNYQRYADIFDKKNILIIRTEDLKDNYSQVIFSIQEYLKIDHEYISSTKSNTTYYSDSLFARTVKKIWSIGQILPNNIYKILKPLYSKFMSFFVKSTKPVVNQLNIEALVDIYKDEYVFLDNLI